MNIYIWGTGELASEYLNQKEIDLESILGFIESRKSKDIFMGKKVFTPEEVVQKNDYDYILACVHYYGKDIYDTCKQVKIDTNKLVLVDNWVWADGSSMKDLMQNCHKVNSAFDPNIKELFPLLSKVYIQERDMIASRYISVLRNGYDMCDKEALILKDDFLIKDYQMDYFRYRTFELMANEIIKKEVDGNVAEVGVFRGTFSKMINAKFPNKKLYLFDTFESFALDEFKRELSYERCPENFMEMFKPTSVNEVLSIMPYPEMCVIKKGLFPNTADGLEDEVYAFVSIDVDFEQSILEGLRYFYPRLNRGGSIFLHDYNNRFLEGVKKAIATYEQEIDDALIKVPLADEGGTLVIVR